jgi:cytochrome d ubiquinol oxidase subunit II
VNADAPRLWDRLTGAALPLVIVSAVCGLAVLALLAARHTRGTRELAVVAVAAVVWAWGVAQHPYLLPTSLTIDAGAGAHGSQVALLVVFGAALVIVVPALGLLLALRQRSLLDEH